MKQFFSIVGILMTLCLHTACDSNIVQPIEEVNVRKHNVEKRYQEAVEFYSSLKKASTRGLDPSLPPVTPDKPISLARFSRFVEYGETIDNVLSLSDSDLEEVCQNTDFQDMCLLIENDVNVAYSYIYDYMDENDLAACENAIVNYVMIGGHDLDLLGDLTWEMENETAFDLTCYAAALFDEYVGEEIIDNIVCRDVVSQSKPETCEEVRSFELAILCFDLSAKYVISACFGAAPPALFGALLLNSTYGLARYVQIEVNYRLCVKNRGNSGNSH